VGGKARYIEMIQLRASCGHDRTRGQGPLTVCSKAAKREGVVLPPHPRDDHGRGVICCRKSMCRSSLARLRAAIIKAMNELAAEAAAKWGMTEESWADMLKLPD